MSECIICGQEANVNKHHLYDDRYGYPGKFQLERCQMCGHAFLQHEFTPKRLSELYSNYYPRSGFDLDHYQPYQEQTGFLAWLDGMNSSAFRWVPKNIRILDIGCGFGESLGYHAARGCNVYGVETDENIRRVADKFGFMVHVGLFNPDIYEPDYFDFVTMDQVIEHTTDPVQTLKGVSRILNPGGTAVLTTPNAHGWGRKVFGLRWINWHAPYHLQFFSRSSMKLAAEKAGLCIETIRTITPSSTPPTERGCSRIIAPIKNVAPIITIMIWLSRSTPFSKRA